MKKTIAFITGIVVLMGATAFKMGTGEDPIPVLRKLIIPKGVDIKTFNAEDYPNMQAVKVTNATAEILIEQAPSNLHLNGFSISPTLTPIAKTALESLKTQAAGLACNPACVDWMIGLRITFGQIGSKLITFYQPVYLCADEAAFYDTDGIKKRRYDLCGQGGSYTITSSGAFDLMSSPAEITTMTNAIALYRTPYNSTAFGVEVRDGSTGALVDFIDTSDDDYTGHAKALVFPIDELIELSKATGKVALWNVDIGMKIDANDLPLPPIYKHDLLLSTNNVTYNSTTNAVTIPSYATFSDLSNICPPSCNGKRFIFRVQ